MIESIVHVAWGNRHFIAATTYVTFVAMHLVWTEEATNTIENIYKNLEHIRKAFPRCREIVFCSDSNVSLQRNAKTECKAYDLTGA